MIVVPRFRVIVETAELAFK